MSNTKNAEISFQKQQPPAFINVSKDTRLEESEDEPSSSVQPDTINRVI